MALIAQMVARNETGRHLTPVLERLMSQVDTLVLTDDASDDATPEVAEAFGAYVYRMDEPTFVKDESKLRRQAWQNLTNHANVGDWILCIDADEMFFPVDLDTWMAQERYPVLGITFYHMWNDTQFRMDKAWKPTLSSRMFRYAEGGAYEERALAGGAEPSYVRDWIRRGLFAKHTGFRMQHLGYQRAEDQAAKYERYMALDGGAFHARAHLESILDATPRLIDWTDNDE